MPNMDMHMDAEPSPPSSRLLATNVLNVKGRSLR
jgi:hypothetical protein